VREAGADNRVGFHDLPRGLLAGGLEDDQTGIDGAESGAGENQAPIG
jgi:hypothetical protein